MSRRDFISKARILYCGAPMDIQTLILYFKLVGLSAGIVVLFLLLTYFRKFGRHTEALDRHIEKLDSHTKALDQHIEKLDSHASELERHTERVGASVDKL